MTKQSNYDPEQLQRRLQEIEAGTGEPYVPGEDPAVDAAMLLQDANHPMLAEDRMLAIGAGLLLTTTSLNAPTMSESAFNNIEAMLQAQIQLQSAPQPVMSDEAVNALDAQLRLQAAPRPVMSNEALVRIEQQLLQTTKPNSSFLGLAAVILLALFGVLAVVGITLNNSPEIEGLATESELIVVPDASEESVVEVVETVEPTHPYDSEIVAVFPEDFAEEAAATAEPSPEVQTIVPDEPTEEPTLVSLVNIFELPPALVLEGPIQTLEDNAVIIYDLTFNYDHDTTLLNGYRVGDTVHIEGAVNPYTDAYVILSIEPVYDGTPNRPVIVSSVGDEPDSPIDTPTIIASGSDDTDSDTPVTSATGGNAETPTTTGSTGGVGTDTGECGDGDDANQGRGQECNQGESNRPSDRGRGN
jgi:hypothetical protein